MLWLPTIEDLRDKHHALRRFAGYRWAVAIASSAALTSVAYLLLGGPPARFGEWPPEARTAASHLVLGLWRLSFAGGVLWGLSLAEWIGDRWWRWFVRAMVMLAACGLGCDGLDRLSRGLVAAHALPGPGFAAVLRAACWATLLPMAIGSLPLLREALDERLGMVPALRRLLRTGVAPSGGWMTGARLKAFTRPLPKNE
jgi:hypothetical protein